MALRRLSLSPPGSVRPTQEPTRPTPGLCPRPRPPAGNTPTGVPRYRRFPSGLPIRGPADLPPLTSRPADRPAYGPCHPWSCRAVARCPVAPPCRSPLSCCAVVRRPVVLSCCCPSPVARRAVARRPVACQRRSPSVGPLPSTRRSSVAERRLSSRTCPLARWGLPTASTRLLPPALPLPGGVSPATFSILDVDCRQRRSWILVVTWTALSAQDSLAGMDLGCQLPPGQPPGQAERTKIGSHEVAHGRSASRCSRGPTRRRVGQVGQAELPDKSDISGGKVGSDRSGEPGGRAGSASLTGRAGARSKPGSVSPFALPSGLGNGGLGRGRPREWQAGSGWCCQWVGTRDGIRRREVASNALTSRHADASTATAGQAP
jgi:hypothetical protein